MAVMDSIKMCLKLIGRNISSIAEVKTDISQNFSKSTAYTDEKCAGVTSEMNKALGNMMTNTNPTATGSLSINRKQGSAIGDRSCALGYNNVASGANSYAEGNNTVASGYDSHAEGCSTNASGQRSHAEGSSTTASGGCSHAEGFLTKAQQESSHAEGRESAASGYYSHAEGEKTKASSNASHSEGTNTVASGGYSHAEGGYTTASGYYSHAEGYQTIASGQSQHVQGKFNKSSTSYAHIVGNGGSASSRSNAHTLDWNGVGWFAGGLKVGGTGQDDANAKTVATLDDIADWTVVRDETLTEDIQSLVEDIGDYREVQLAIRGRFNNEENTLTTGDAVASILIGEGGYGYTFERAQIGYLRAADYFNTGIQIYTIAGVVPCVDVRRIPMAKESYVTHNGRISASWRDLTQPNPFISRIQIDFCDCLLKAGSRVTIYKR